MKRILPFFLMLFCTAPMAAEDIGYRIVHPDGTVEFTDDATRGGEEIKLRDVQTVNDHSNDEGVRKPDTETAPEKKKTSGYTTLRILTPGAGETVWFADSGVTVAVSSDPALKSGDTVVLSLDGAEVARGKNTSLNIGQVYRGTHTLSATIVDAGGKTVIRSSSVTFYLKQHSK